MRITRVDEIAPVTGERSPNRTGSRFGVYGTDLGILWDNGSNEILVAFGDTYGEGWGGNGTGPDDADWRWNVLAGSTTTDLREGIALYPVVTRPDGTAGQMLPHDLTVEHEVTIIPTSGIAAAGVNYLHYMSVRRWGPPGRWRTNHSGIALSHDLGRTWTAPADARWPNTDRRTGLFGRREHPFQLGAFARQEPHVYLMGTPNGRFGGGSLARVDPARVSEVDSYEYWTGSDWKTGDPFAAVEVLPGPVGELSLLHHKYTDRWLATHLDEGRAAIVLRTALELVGPWSEPLELVSGRDYPGLYGGFLHPWCDEGPDVYFMLSLWNSYNVRLMRASLEA